MVEIVEVKTKKQKKAFVKFQLDLYKGNSYFCPPIVADELSLFDAKKNANYDECDMVYYLAYKNEKLVGRIAGIIQNTSNKKSNQKCVRFSRVDFINDEEVAAALINAVIDWGKSKGMEAIQGPLGFNDLDKEGLLIEGFNQLCSFAEGYNYDYYQKLIENQGFKKEVDWVEYKIDIPEKYDERLDRLSEKLCAKYNLKVVNLKSTKKVIAKYKDQIFKLVNECYDPLYETVPINKKMEEQLIQQFKLFINYKFIGLVTNEKDEIVGFGLVMPGVAKVMQATNGRIFNPKILKILKVLKHPESIDMLLIAVKPEYRTKGVASMVLNFITKNLVDLKVKNAESLLQLENNHNIQNLFSGFNRVNHKRRRCYIKYFDQKDDSQLKEEETKNSENE